MGLFSQKVVVTGAHGPSLTLVEMNPILGWGLAALLLVLAWQGYGWRGVVAAVTGIVFWLLLQFSRALRVMKNAGSAPVGHVDSAVMLHAKLHPRMTMLQVVGLTRSLGQRVDEAADVWAWQDAGASRVVLHFERGRLVRFELERAPESAAPATDPEPPAP